MIVRLHNYLKLRLSEQNECRKLKASHNCYGVVETETFEYSYITVGQLTSTILQPQMGYLNIIHLLHFERN